MSPAYGYDDDGEREHDSCDACGSGSCPGSGSGGEDACTYRPPAPCLSEAQTCEPARGYRCPVHYTRPPAPPLSPAEREVVQRFEDAPDGLVADDLCDCGSGATRAGCDPAYGGGSNVSFIACTPDGVVTTYYDDGTWTADLADGA